MKNVNKWSGGIHETATSLFMSKKMPKGRMLLGEGMHTSSTFYESPFYEYDLCDILGRIRLKSKLTIMKADYDYWNQHKKQSRS